MSQFIDPDVGPTLAEQFSLARAKKAYGAGVGGAIAGAATISLSGVFADGKVDGSEVIAAGTAVAGGFIVGFFGAWLPRQTPAPPKQTPADVVAPGDGLAVEPKGTRSAE